MVFTCTAPTRISEAALPTPTTMAVREAAIFIISLWGHPASFIDAILSLRKPLPSAENAAAT